MKTLSNHITESFTIESSALDNAIKKLSIAQRLPTSGSKIKTINSSIANISTEIEKLDTDELIKLWSSASNGSAMQLYVSKELISRAYEKLENEANAKRQGTIGNVQTIKHAIEILQAK